MKHLINVLKILALVSLNVFVLCLLVTLIWGDYDPSGRVVEGPAWLKDLMRYSLWGLGSSLGFLCLYGLNKILIEDLF